MPSILITLFLAFAYCIRGGLINTGGTQASRLLWGLCLAIAIATLFPAIPMYVIAMLPLLTWLGLVVIGHSAYQNAWISNPIVTNTAHKQHEWLTQWLPDYKEGHTIRNITIGFTGNACIEAARATIILLPTLYWHPALAIAIPLCAVGRGFAYLLGEILAKYQLLPSNITAFTKVDGNIGVVPQDYGHWKEYFNGLSWGIALVLAKFV